MARLAALLLALVANAAFAQNACDECRNGALAQSAVCHRNALNPTDGAECTLKLQAERERCQQSVCKAEAEERLYALCPECAKLTSAKDRAQCRKSFCAPANTSRKK